MSFAEDTFTRSNQTPWGTATDGVNTWVQKLGTSTASVLSNQGRVTGTTTLNKFVLGGTLADQDINVRFQVSNIPASIGICLRSTGNSTHYACQIINTSTVRISKTVSGVFTQLTTGACVLSVNTFYQMRARIQGNVISVRVWLDGASEPGTWNATFTDTLNSITGAGDGGLLLTLAANLNTADFDNFYFNSLSTTKDVNARARVTAAQIKDAVARARLLERQTPTLSTDTFVRANQAGWGTSSNVEIWYQIGGAQSASIVSNAGQITAAVGAATFVLGTKHVIDADLKIRAQVSSVASGGDRMGVAIRVIDATTQYRVYWGADTGLTIMRANAGVETVLNSTSFAVTASTYYWVRGQALTQTNGLLLLSAKIWADGSGEPGSWTITYTDTNPMVGAGGHGVYLYTGNVADLVIVNSYTALANTIPYDLNARARVRGFGIRDANARARVGGTSRARDASARVRIRGSGIGDVWARVSIGEPVNALPAFAAYSLQIKIGTIVLPFIADMIKPYLLDGSFHIGEASDGRDTCSFTIVDPTGMLHLEYRQQVTVTHNVRGDIFYGYINTADEHNIPPNVTNEIVVNCIDEHWIADKNYYEGSEFVGAYAGSVAANFASQLAGDGIVAGYALQRETTVNDFAKGTLVNVAADNTIGEGVLELAPAGQTVSIVEDSYADFHAGTLSGVQANKSSAAFPDTLSLAATPAMKFQATCSMPGGGDLRVYTSFWQGAYTVQSGDKLRYDMWIASDSPKQMAAIDFTTSDGKTLRSYSAPNNARDQSGMFASPSIDLGVFAKDKWYTRLIDLSLFVGKSIQHVDAGIEGDQTGTYTAYFRRVQIVTGAGVVKATFYYTNILSQIHTMQIRGYSDISLTSLWSYERTGYRISPSYSLKAVGVVRSTIVTWGATLPDTFTLLVEASIDGGQTYQPCTSGQVIAGLIAGLGVSGTGLMFRQTLTNTGKDPTLFASLNKIVASVSPSYAATKQDVIKTTTTSQDWQQGTLSNLSYANNVLSLGGITRNWDDGNISGQTLYGAFSPSIRTDNAECRLIGNSGGDVKSRLDFVGQWQNFIIEVDIDLSISTNENLGVVYRTTGWQNNNDTYAYSVFLHPLAITLSKGTNSASGAGSYTQIATAAMTLSSGNTHHLKVVVNGNNHQVSLDDVLLLNATDGTYTGSGYIGLRYYNGSGATGGGSFDNFGIGQLATSGYRISPSIDLSPAVTIWDSYIGWDDVKSIVGDASLVVETSIDNGSTWQACTNGASIPNITQGDNANLYNLLVRTTLATGSVIYQPAIDALTIWVIGWVSASGYRIAPPLSLSPVGTVGSSEVNWIVNEPSGTTFRLDVSRDGVNWIDVTGNLGGEIPFITSKQQPAYIDVFDADHSSLYSTGALVGSPTGVNATWGYDNVNNQVIATGGVYAYYAYTGQVLGDGEIIFDVMQAERGGCMWRLSNVFDTCYELNVQDDSSTSRPANIMRLMKVQNGQHQQVGLSTAILFVRGRPTRFKIVQLGKTITITASFPRLASDGSVLGAIDQVFTYVDPSPLPGGYVALRSNGGTNVYTGLRIQQYGDDVSNASLYTRARFNTTNPLYTPQLTNLTVGVYSDDIDKGVIVPATTYSITSGSKNSIAQDWDDLAKQSNYLWKIRNKHFKFHGMNAVYAPYILTQKDMLVGSDVKVSKNSDLYRNEQVIIGAIDIEQRIEYQIADGFKAGFDTLVAIDSMDSIIVGGYAATFGIKNVDIGKDWYYQQGQKGIVQDISGVLVPKGVSVEIDYNGQVPIIVKARNNGQIALLKSLDGTSGKVSIVEDGSGLTRDAATTLAVSRLSQYSILTINISFSTYRPGLKVGQVAPIFFPQHAIANIPFIITSVDYAPETAIINGVQTLLEHYAVQCTSGAIVGSWLQLFS